jgi:hypothetical protein
LECRPRPFLLSIATAPVIRAASPNRTWTRTIAKKTGSVDGIGMPRTTVVFSSAMQGPPDFKLRHYPLSRFETGKSSRRGGWLHGSRRCCDLLSRGDFHSGLPQCKLSLQAVGHWRFSYKMAGRPTRFALIGGLAVPVEGTLNGGRDLGMLQACGSGLPTVAHCPDRPFLPHGGRGSCDAAGGVSLYGCRANRDRRLLRKDGDERPCHASAHETDAVQGHFARLCQSGGLYLFAGASSSVNRTRVPNHLWTRGILVAPCFASRAVDQTRPLPPYSELHSRLIEPEGACACLWIASRRIQRAFNHAFPRGYVVSKAASMAGRN